MHPNNPLSMLKTAPRAWLAIGLACGALALAGCDKNDGRTVGEKVDAGIAKTEQAASTAAEKTKDAVKDTTAKVENSTVLADTKDAIKDAGTATKDAVKDAGAAVSKTTEDASVTAAVSAGLAKDADLSAIKIDVDTKSGAVTLKGPAPSAAAKSRAGDIAKAVSGVTSVDNQLEVKM